MENDNKMQEAVKRLKAAQDEICREMYALAKSAGLSNDNVKPITDGVYDIAAYLSSIKVMWVLKEPYDDFKDGKPYGGGWEVYEAFDYNGAWANRTWQPIIYSMYGLFYNLHWQDMDYIRDKPEMVNILKRLAYINISKMPAHKQTNDAMLWEYYEIWRPILLKQIEIYAPDVIVFGNTFRYFKRDLVGEETQPDKIFDDYSFCTYHKNDTLLIDAYHPNQKRITRETYVNTIIDLVRESDGGKKL